MSLATYRPTTKTGCTRDSQLQTVGYCDRLADNTELRWLRPSSPC